MSLWAALRFCVRQRTSKFHASDLKVEKKHTLCFISAAWRRLRFTNSTCGDLKKNLILFRLLLLRCAGGTLLRLETRSFWRRHLSSPNLAVRRLQCFFFYSRLCVRVVFSDFCLLCGSEHDADSYLSPRSVTAAWQDCKADLIPPRLVYWQPFSPARLQKPFHRII